MERSWLFDHKRRLRFGELGWTFFLSLVFSHAWHGALEASETEQNQALGPAEFSLSSKEGLRRVPNQTLRLPQHPGSDLRAELAFPLSFDQPIGFAAPPGETNRLFVLEKPGRIVAITNLAAPTRTMFLDLSDRVFSEHEGGLLGMAFHPRFALNGYFYITYTFSTNGLFDGIHLRLSRFQASPTNPNAAAAESELPLITQYDGDPWHQGGDLQFGPDGYLYVSVGDGGQFGIETVQRIDQGFFGGLLRIDVDQRPGSLPPNPHPGGAGHYRVPPDNPFVGATRFNGAPVDPHRVRTEFYALGLRNPWRFSFDPATGDLYANDTGSSYREEVNLILKGANYGWPFDEGSLALRHHFEGTPKPSALLPPMAEYGYEEGGAGSGKAIAAGILYRGQALPALDGAYLFTDFWTGDIGMLRPSASPVLAELRELQSEIAQWEDRKLLADSRLAQRQAAWEQSWAAADHQWQVVAPVQFSSLGGATLSPQPDGSLFAEGKLPWEDVYTVHARTDLPEITAVRLELLPDDALPYRGPGRSAGGNVVLTSFEVSAAPWNDPSQLQTAAWGGVTADFAQTGWEVEKVLDGNSQTGWAISPAVGQAHEAVFELQRPIGFPGGTMLTFVLHQNLGSQVTIGRFRLSVSAAQPPPRADDAAAVADILRLPAGSRSAAQNEKLARFYRSIDPELLSIQEQIGRSREEQVRVLNQQALPVEWIGRVPGIASFAVHPGDGTLLVADMINGAIRRLVLPAGEGGSFPASLKDTGLFTDLETLTPAPGVVPYTVNVPFWSDNASKRRWFSLSDPKQTIQFSRDGHWKFPPGTVWVKHFELEITNGLARSARRLETRVLVSHALGVHGATYRWDPSGRQATLVPAEGQKETIATFNRGVVQRQDWRYPSRSQCLQCHTAAGGYALGFHTAQLNRETDYGGAFQNQIEALNQAGYFSAPVTNLHALPALASAADFYASREYRVRSYLHANCSQCHQPGGTGRSLWDARVTTPRRLAGIIDGAVVHGTLSPEDRVIKPGSLEHSVLWQRLSEKGPRHMPPLGTSLVNKEALDLLASWIRLDLANYESFEAWQTRMFRDPLDAAAEPEADPDRDGVKNYAEYLMGTDPRLAADRFQWALEAAGEFRYLTFARPANLSFEVQWAQSLVPPVEWRALDSPANQPFFHAFAGETVVEDFAALDSMRFYRVVVSEP